MIVTIDGPAGAGKSTVAAIIGEKTKLRYVNSGNLYRAITFGIHAHFREELTNLIETKPTKILEALYQFSFKVLGDKIILNGTALSEEDLHNDIIDDYVPTLSSIPLLREWVNRILRDIHQHEDIIVEGRDMSTVVFPNADIKLYLDANLTVRTQRRFEQGTSELDLEEMQRRMHMRDKIDRKKTAGSLQRSPDARYLDTSDLTLAQVCEIIIVMIQEYKSAEQANMMSHEQQDPKTSTLLQEELQEAYLKSLDVLEVGQLVKGTIVAVTHEQVFVDIGYKSEGKIYISEFADSPVVGDIVQVVLINKEGRNGEVVVSKQKADEYLGWKHIKEAFHNTSSVEGEVRKVVKGGFEVSLDGGSIGFNPISKMDFFKIEDPLKYVGIKSQFHIERLYSDNRVNIILSRRKWLEEEMHRKRNEFFQNSKEGDVVEGMVKTFTSFGAFVDLGGFDGLLHINDMSWGHVAKPKDCVKKGQCLQLKLIRLDAENQKINLSLKDMTTNPWENFTDRFQLHDTIQGTVTKLAEFGAFIELERGIEGLAHISELSWTKRIKHPDEVLEIGEEVKVKILGFDLDARKVSLGIKQNLPNPWDDVETRYPKDKRLTGKVKKITSTGAFVELEEGVDGFLHSDDLSWNRNHRNLHTVLTVDQEIAVIVLESNSEKHNIRLGVKHLESNPWTELINSYSEGSIVQAEVTTITDFGIFAEVQGGIEGLIPKMHLGDPKTINLEEELGKYKAGQKITAVILELNPEKQKLSLSIREISRSQERQAIAKYNADNTDAESPATIADFLKQDNSK